MEVAVRKYEVDMASLVATLREHKGTLTNREIAEKLNRPITLVEHWFRTDKSFAIPDPDIWFELKKLLNIETDIFDKSITEFEFKGGNYDMRNRIHVGNTTPTLTGGCGNSLHLLEVPIYCIDGDKLGKAEREGGSGLGVREGDAMYTLTAKDRHGVAYTVGEPICVADHPTPKVDEKGVAFTLNSRDYKAPLCAAYLGSGKDTVGTLMANAGTKLWLGNQEAFSGDYHIIEECSAAGVDCRNATEYPESVGALQASADHNLNSNNVVRTQYIVRRLTPTECARLQGFPDEWAHPDKKDDFTDEEYTFWLSVRNAHAEINGKQVKDYTKAQMLTWYNKLHTDSAEYKLWGNGIALPNALYVMQGIADVLK
jgi:DNA (cytosine-5)-methyltransferase 1